jgi:hypothetical protein
MKAGHVFCMVALAAAYPIALIGVSMGGTSRATLGAGLLAVAGVLVVTVIMWCLRDMRQQTKQDDSDVQLLRRLKEQGVLNSMLQQIERN